MPARRRILGPALVGALATAGLAMTAALAVSASPRWRPRASRSGPALRRAQRRARCPGPMIVATSALALLCVVLGLVPGLLLPRLAGLLPGRERRLHAADRRERRASALRPWREPGCALPAPAGCPRSASPSSCGAHRDLLLARGRRRAAPAPVWTCGQRAVPALLWTSAGFHQAAAAGSGGRASTRRARCSSREGRRACNVSPTRDRCRTCSTRLLRPVRRARPRRRRRCATPAVGQSAGLRAYLLALMIVAAGCPAGMARMKGAAHSVARARRTPVNPPPSWPAACRWWAASPSPRCCPAWCSTSKAACRAVAGRRRCSPTANCAASGRAAWSTPRAPRWSTGWRRRGGRLPGHGRAARPGGRAAPAVADRARRPGAGRPAGPCSLRSGRRLLGYGKRLRAHGRARDLTLGVAVEGLLLLVVVMVALPAGSTDLLSLSDAGAGAAIWSLARPLAGGGRFRPGGARRDGPPARRQSRHPPRTHHDPRRPAAGVRRARPGLPAMGGSGPALGHAGARLELFLPRPPRSPAGSWCWPSACRLLCVALAVVETWLAKMRLLRVPAAAGYRRPLCFLGLVTWFTGGRL